MMHAIKITMRATTMESIANLLRVALLMLGVSVTLLPVSLQANPTMQMANTQVDITVNGGTLVRLSKPASNVFIANPEIADIQVKSPRLIYVFGKTMGTTTLYAVSENDDVIFSGNVKVSHNLTDIRQTLKTMMPRSNVDIELMNGVLVLTGNAKSPAEAEDAKNIAQTFIGKNYQVINRLQIATPTQVNLRVRVAEVARDVSKRLGFNWEGTLGGSTFIGILNGRDVFDVVTNEALNMPMKEFFAGADNAGSLFGSISTGKLDINGIIDALETEGFLTVLAEPNLTALSGEFASFLAGGEFPIPVPQENGVITIDYRSFGVGLQFTPTVLSNNTINLKVQPEVSQLSSAGAITLNGFAIPALTTRRAETTVELASGQSFAIAGLLQNNLERELQKFPGLGDIPVLGALFRSDKFRRQETELIIIVTPYIVNPVKNGIQIPIPQDGLKMPNDLQRYIEGKSYQHMPKDAPQPMPMPGQQTGTASGGFMLN